MAEKILVVHAAALRQLIAFEYFKALPAEEIERLHGAIEVVAMDRDLAGSDPGCKQLVTYTAVHYNYSWLTHLPGGALDQAGQRTRRALGVGAPLLASDREVVFLDQELQAAAARAVDSTFTFGDRFELRLAGLLDNDDDEASRPYLGLVYVARLLRPGASACAEGIAQVRFFGNGELQMQRDEFDPWSQILIDNLPAF